MYDLAVRTKSEINGIAIVVYSLNILQSLYVFWAMICASGIVLLGLWASESKDIPLERMLELFRRPWYQCWRSTLGPACDVEEVKMGDLDDAIEERKGPVMVIGRESSFTSAGASRR